MPFVANTPESLLARNDSKNPTSTCRGITASGRPCRRPVTSADSLLPPSGRSRRPVTPDPRDENLYCWQHKEQASMSARSSPGPRGTATPILEGRSSLDTLADRLGLVELQEKPKKRRDGRTSQNGAVKQPVKTRRKNTQKLEFCFCFSIPIEEKAEPPIAVRPQPRPVQRTSIPVPSTAGRSKQSVSASPSAQRLSASHASPGRKSYASRKSNASQTAQLKDLIPDTLDMVTASALLAELARPYVDSEEAGFIYMFWLTPASEDSPPVAAAQSLLAPPSPSPKARSRRASDVVSSFAKASGDTDAKTMMLKIGRAANVQRRMNQWQRQCGYGIEMLRFYPYVPGASDSSSGAVPRMTPHAHRVERLVHIELAGMGLRANMDTCNACGRDHREWFEVDATRDGIRKVDDVIRRWVEWDEASA